MEEQDLEESVVDMLACRLVVIIFEVLVKLLMVVLDLFACCGKCGIFLSDFAGHVGLLLHSQQRSA